MFCGYDVITLIPFVPVDIKRYVLAERVEELYVVIWLSLVHQSNDRAAAVQRSSQNGLQQRMRCDFHDDCVVGYMLQSFLEQHRTHHVVDVVVG